MDILMEMFRLQSEMVPLHSEVENANQAITVHPSDFGELNDRIVQMRLRYLAWCIVEELAESVGELKNKPHRLEDRLTDAEAFDAEVGDVMMYFVEFCITAGLTPDRLLDRFVAAHTKCMERLHG